MDSQNDMNQKKLTIEIEWRHMGIEAGWVPTLNISMSGLLEKTDLERINKLTMLVNELVLQERKS